MDTSETNIKMSEKAEEIQGLWKPRVGDWFYKRDGIAFGLWLICKVEGDVLFCSGERMSQPPFNGSLVEFRAPENYIWLPLEHQLWDMLQEGRTSDDAFDNVFYGLLHEFVDLHDGYTLTPDWAERIEIRGGIRTLEQLLRAFVMKERYNKIWDGEKWIAE